MDEYYGWMFENSVPGLPEAAAQESADAARRTCASTASSRSRTTSTAVRGAARRDALAGARRSTTTTVVERRHADRRARRRRPLAGFTTPSRQLEFYSQTLVDWGWPEHAVPRYVPGHVHWRDLKRDEGEFDLLPNFRLPTLIHTRSPVKWLYEISHDNPLWIATADARQLRHRDRRPGQGADAHRLLRHARLGHRRHPPRRARHVASPRTLAAATKSMGNRNASALVTIDRAGQRLQSVAGPRRAAVREQRSRQLAHLVERGRRAPEPDVPGAARPGQRHALLAPARDAREGRRPTIATATSSSTPTKSHEVYKEWMAMTRPAPGPDGLRRPLWFDRPLRPTADAYKV